MFGRTAELSLAVRGIHTSVMAILDGTMNIKQLKTSVPFPVVHLDCIVSEICAPHFHSASLRRIIFRIWKEPLTTLTVKIKRILTGVKLAI